MSKNNAHRVPTPTLERLATYLTTLSELAEQHVQTISSSDMERLTGINAAQFRKDLSYFGEFGRPGIGYDVEELRSRMARILKVERQQPVLLVGAGNLGSALAGYPGLRAQNFHIVAVFDNNYNKIGRLLWDLEIRDVGGISQVNDEFQARIGIIAVPSNAAQEVMTRLVDAGVKAILNFAPIPLKVPAGVVVRNVDFVQELTVLAFHLDEDIEMSRPIGQVESL
ncbi:MAG: redox-sensing transcriptional repressor Rex [Armatimonadetes bacterium]|nr:redox-sensing transcriptional repressor Rex [Armatimonadota bacterium]